MASGNYPGTPLREYMVNKGGEYRVNTCMLTGMFNFIALEENDSQPMHGGCAILKTGEVHEFLSELRRIRENLWGLSGEPKITAFVLSEKYRLNGNRTVEPDAFLEEHEPDIISQGDSLLVDCKPPSRPLYPGSEKTITRCDACKYWDPINSYSLIKEDGKKVDI